ncbi:leucine-rich repeat-containing G-protein coupled receptor 5 [Ischnura elegans]|uniref:leucine-rich repeat-containing G-protein coupled receptor 5 n=1 Tax=Ischnura elegans TaxID=197161 RepID=UPI001ED8AB0B|nr:leucine-rich repeat-containing G-protein coupled receptor 5 [Ischnura elegans]
MMMASNPNVALRLPLILLWLFVPTFICSIINSTTTLPPQPTQLCPARCRCEGKETGAGTHVTSINCSGVDLSQFPSNLPDTATVLDLSLNRIGTLPTPGSLAYLENLEKLSLRGNSLEGPLGPKSFLGLVSLKVIDLSHNGITSLHNDTFYGCDQLQSLDLTGNRGLEKIPYFNSSSIQNMTLDRCGLVDSGMDKPILPPSLSKLSLKYNSLANIPKMVGKNLYTLDLRLCDLSIVHRDSLQGMPFLTHLYVSGNPRLTSLAHLRSESLRIIDAEDCSLGSDEGKAKKGPTHTPVAPLASMTGLTHGHLSGNRIQNLGPNSFSSSRNLVHLDLSRNGLETVASKSLSRLTKLQRLNFSHNAIKSLDETTFSENVILRVLDLSHNGKLTHLPAFDAVSLRVLLASRCDISGIGIRGEGNPLHNMPNVEVLDVSRNPLEVLPKDMASPGLKHLDLSFCRITVVESQTLKGLIHLVWLDLRGNRIATLDPGAVRGLRYLAVSDNPWNCDCGNSRFQDLWTLLDKTEPKGQDLHCAPNDKERMLATPKEIVPPGEGYKHWEEVCPRATTGVPVPASSMWSLSVAMVLAVAAFMVGGVVFRHWMRERRKSRLAAEEVVERSQRRRRVVGRRRRGAHRSTTDEDDEDDESVEIRVPTRDVVVVRPLRVETLPPSYEEAVLMPRPEEVEVRLEVAEVEPVANGNAAPGPAEEVEEPGDAATEDRPRGESTQPSGVPGETASG